jgi:hypothetical protein
MLGQLSWTASRTDSEDRSVVYAAPCISRDHQSSREICVTGSVFARKKKVLTGPFDSREPWPVDLFRPLLSMASRTDSEDRPVVYAARCIERAFVSEEATSAAGSGVCQTGSGGRHQSSNGRGNGPGAGDLRSPA